MSISFTSVDQLPLLTAAVPGHDGALGEADDFEVEEIPAYLPCGEGQHAYAWVQKRGLTTPEAVARICSAVEARAEATGYAGLKDKHGVTRQWISFDGVDPARLAGLELPGLQVLKVAPHRNRLRTGHLRGNRFAVRVRGAAGEALGALREALEQLTRRGLPNYYGPQRFGVRGDNALHGLRALRGEDRLPRDRRQRRLLVSALQAQLFNEVVAERLKQQRLFTIIPGDVLQRSDSGGVFSSEDLLSDQRRLDAGEVMITGPICGPKMKRPRQDTEARAWEDALLGRWVADAADFARFGKLAPGTRRHLLARVEAARVERIGSSRSEGPNPSLRSAGGTVPPHPLGDVGSGSGDTTLELRFSLPAGSYASVLLRELFKREMLGPR